MAGVLFLAHRVPFPPDRGDRIRSHHLLKALAKLAPVHVGCFAEGDRAGEQALADQRRPGDQRMGIVVPGGSGTASIRSAPESA